MLISQLSIRKQLRFTLLIIGLLTLILWTWGLGRSAPKRTVDLAIPKSNFPLTWKYVHSFNGTGGAWYIPEDWMAANDSAPQTIVEAARIASRAALSNTNRLIPYSKIPLIIHQTSRYSLMNTWNPKVLPWVEQWVQHSVSPTDGKQMAYFFWDDEGILELVRDFERDLLDDLLEVFTPVERADIFRILACKWFGGVYADVDTEPLHHPANWIGASDIARWTDDKISQSYGIDITAIERPEGYSNRGFVQLLWGLEADLDPEANLHWRMGYTYPVQLTQWALASGPMHPVFSQFLDNLKGQIREAKDSPNKARLADPLTRTGPAAVTLATTTWLERVVNFRWNALTGRHDGGKSKLVSDVLVLPITGFSPGRGKYGNMGSKPILHPDARLYHHGLGSWKHFDLLVEIGKFCRTSLGLCKNWSKVPS